MSGASDAFNKLRKAVDDNADKVQGMVGKAANAAKKATGGAHDDKIDKGAQAAEDYLDKRSGQEEGSGEEGKDDKGDQEGKDDRK
ncbi:Rv0909 family putative TA system antitoxin [Nocardiopsis xinjiangensis]|uniref:Rv0909 family putative TA system antitoxin n=1 Tax=Nocardiopsis xinjiangensis TaxID=124285 RepID=UPI0003470E05|nr:Rv0909 family putative TA system antitoxin [Nocardiopsis xinjiangensis]